MLSFKSLLNVVKRARNCATQSGRDKSDPSNLDVVECTVVLCIENRINGHPLAGWRWKLGAWRMFDAHALVKSIFSSALWPRRRHRHREREKRKFELENAFRFVRLNGCTTHTTYTHMHNVHCTYILFHMWLAPAHNAYQNETIYSFHSLSLLLFFCCCSKLII